MTGASLRSVHFHGHTDANRHSTVEIAGKGTVKPAIERDMDAVRALGVDVASGAAMPSIVLREDEKAAARAWLDRGKLPQPLLTIGLGASRPTKSWPVERYAALATAWHARTGGGIVALAGPDESSLLQLFVESLGTGDRRPPVLCESRLSVRQLAAVLACARVHVGNDSGPKHLAIAVGTRTVTLFGPEHPLEWHPYPADLHPFLFVEGLPCRRDAHPGMPPWCGLQVCTEEKHKCMRMIPVDRVLERCLETQGP